MTTFLKSRILQNVEQFSSSLSLSSLTSSLLGYCLSMSWIDLGRCFLRCDEGRFSGTGRFSGAEVFFFVTSLLRFFCRRWNIPTCRSLSVLDLNLNIGQKEQEPRAAFVAKGCPSSAKLNSLSFVNRICLMER